MVSAMRLAVPVSTLFLAIALAAIVMGWCITPWDFSLPLSRRLNVAVWNRGFDSRLVVFNDADYGPYRGSIINVGWEANSLQRDDGFGSTMGIYYRYFQWQSGHELWTLMISLWYFVFGFAITPTVWALGCLRRRTSQIE